LCRERGKKMIDDVIEDNIEYALKEVYKAIPEEASVVIPMGALELSCGEKGETGSFTAGFEVYYRGDVIYRGEANGIVICHYGDKYPDNPCDVEVELVSMEIWLRRV